MVRSPLRFGSPPPDEGSKTTAVAQKARRIGVMDGSIGGPERLSALAGVFPQAQFESIGSDWPDPAPARFDILFVIMGDLSIDEAAGRLRRATGGPDIVVVLHNADLATSRRLAQEGAADVLAYPVSEAAVAICLERLLSRRAETQAPHTEAGQIVALLKAGGGVGATALAAQLAAKLAGRQKGLVCLADLDIQFGAAALYLDLPEAMSLSAVLALGATLPDAPLAKSLATHASGARVLAAPPELMALESLKPAQIDALLQGLRREFAVTLVDLPSAWTAWTHRLLASADRIVLITQLSVPHVKLALRQLRALSAQQLGSIPITLVCNGITSEQQASVSLKAAERALGRPFDVVIPEDSRTMTEAINQGVELSAIRRGTKIEKAIGELADKIAVGEQALQRTRRWL